MDKFKGKTLMIATPMYGGMCSGNYVAGLIQAIPVLNSVGVNVFWSQITNESLITRARNELAHLFLEQKHDYLMFIDADIGFTSHSLLELIKADKDVVGGLYPKKEVDWKRVGLAASQGHKDLKDFSGSFVLNMLQEDKESDAQGCLEVRHTGTGFLLIKRSVFETLAPHVPQYRASTYKDPETGEYVKPLTKEFFATSIDETGALLSEDYHFCDLWRKHGGKIYVNPFIKLDHVGTYVYSGDIFKGGGNLK